LIIAIAADSAGTDAQVSMHAARAPYYLLFGGDGELMEVVDNPHAEAGHGAGPRAAEFLQAKGVTQLIAGEFGPRLVAELEQRGIGHRMASGVCADVMVKRMGT
jgi:predicted Fe-Mo cluster-binding NifX family protein